MRDRAMFAVIETGPSASVTVVDVPVMISSISYRRPVLRVAVEEGT